MNTLPHSPTASKSPAIDSCLESVRTRLRRADLFGLLAQAEQILNEPWLARVLEIEECERAAQRKPKRAAAKKAR